MFNTNLHLHTSNNVLFAQWLYLQDTAVLLWAMEQKLNKRHQKFKHKVFFILRIWALLFKVFLEQNKAPTFVLKQPASGKRQRLIVKENTKSVRPIAVAAILRNINLNQQAYDSFIDLQVSY